MHTNIPSCTNTGCQHAILLGMEIKWSPLKFVLFLTHSPVIFSIGIALLVASIGVHIHMCNVSRYILYVLCISHDIA